MSFLLRHLHDATVSSICCWAAAKLALRRHHKLIRYSRTLCSTTNLVPRLSKAASVLLGTGNCQILNYRQYTTSDNELVKINGEDTKQSARTLSSSNNFVPRLPTPASVLLGTGNCRILNCRQYTTQPDNEPGDKVTSEDMKQSSKFLTIPNVLTVSRMAIAPYLGYLVCTENFTWALGMFILAGATDSLDGWIARNVPGQASVIGSFIDPVADKILISVLTFSLTMVDVIPAWLCGMIILRDVLIMLTSGHFHYKHLSEPKTVGKFFDFENSTVKMEPTQISKYNTFLQLGLVTVSIAAPVWGVTDHVLLQAYWYLVAMTTVISGCSYFIKDKSAYKR